MPLGSDAALFAMHATALFVSDDFDRLRYIREPGDAEADLPLAPRFFMGRTLKQNIWRFRHDLPDALIAELEGLCQTEPVAHDLRQPPLHAAHIRAVLQAHAPIKNEYRGPAYWVPDTGPADSAAVVLDALDQAVLERHFGWKKIIQPDTDLGPTTALIVDGVAVSICFCSRIIDAVAEAGVYTIEAARGKGYARAVVSAWVPAVRQSGRFPLYSASWDNLASQRIAQSLGMVNYGEDWSIE